MHCLQLRHYCQMKLALPNNMNKKIRGIHLALLDQLFPPPAVSHEAEFWPCAFGSFPTDVGENYYQGSHCKNLFFSYNDKD